MNSDEIREIRGAAGLLELPDTFNEEDVRSAYKRFARTWHPDMAMKRGLSAENANKMMAEGNRAHRLLMQVVGSNGGSYAISEHEATAGASSSSASYGDYGYDGAYDSSCSDRGTTSGGSGNRKRKRKRSRSSNQSNTTNSGYDRGSTASQQATANQTTTGTYDSGFTTGSLWTWFVFAVAILGFMYWNSQDPKAAFEFAVGILFDPRRLLIFLGIAYGPRIFIGS